MKKIMIAAILFLMIFSVPVMAGYHRPFVPSVKKCSVSGCDRPVTENSLYCSGHKCSSRGCKSKRMSGGIYCATHQSKYNKNVRNSAGSWHGESSTSSRRSSSGKSSSSGTIDEAQGVANQEISLIRNVNGGNVILNLFGDEKQHFEDTKGIDSWNEIMQGSSYKRYDMNENYRNARQITEYCNKCFDLQMQSINVDGRGVHEIWGYETFISECIRIFQSAQNNGLRAIITRTQEEKRYLLEVFSDYRDSLHPLGESDVEIHRNRWNVLTVMEARGLEFGSVIAVAGRMTPNERYVVYTRALDELFVYDEVIYIPDKPVIDDIGGDKWEKPSDYEKKKNKKNNPKKEQVNERGRSKGDYEHSELRDYFTNAGFEVIDQRADGVSAG